MFATFVRDGSHSTGTTFLCENSVFRGRNAKECHSELTEDLDNRALPYRTVGGWAAAFQRGRVASADMRRTGRPRARTVRTRVARAVIAQFLEGVGDVLYRSYKHIQILVRQLCIKSYEKICIVGATCTY